MAKTPELVIDIGQESIKVLQVQAGKDGLSVVKAGVEKLVDISSEESDKTYQQVKDTLPILLQKLGIKQKRAIVSLPGRSAFTRQLKVPVVRGKQLERIIKYEARQHIPFPLDQVNMDYRISESAGDIPELEINLVAVRKEIADGYSQILKKCGIRSDIIEASPLSIYNAYAASPLHDAEEVTAVISIGSSSTDIVIEQNGAMQFMRSAPVAGSALTALLAKQLEVTEEKAEELKLKPATQYDESEGIKSEKVASILEKGFDNIVTEIRRSFDFYVSQPDAQPVTRIFLCGGCVNMEGSAEFLEDRLGVPVQLLDATQIEGLNCPEEYQSFLKHEAALVGMAIRVAGKEGCALSFAPDHIKQSLEIERRAPMLSLMVATVVVMIALSFFFLDKIVSNTANAVTQVSDIVAPGIESKPELVKARTEQTKYFDRYQRINEVAKKRGFLTRVYLEVQSLVPQDIWLESIEATSSKMTIKGRALNDEQVSNYYTNLMMSPFFDNEVVVLKSSDPVTDVDGTSLGQRDFTLVIDRYNEPTNEEVKFVSEFRKLTKYGEVLLVRFDRSMPDNISVIIGVLEIEDMKDRITLLNKIYTALAASGLVEAGNSIVKTIDIRLHDRESNLIEHIQVASDLLGGFRDKRVAQDELILGFAEKTPEPSPTPSHTPTPESGEEDTSSQYGMYGMMGGMYGMGGMGGMGGGMGAPPAAGGEG